MSEAKIIRKTSGLPLTVGSTAEELRTLGVASGMLLLVHTSLSKLGWVCGGPVAVVEAILAVLGNQGTLVMPAHTPHLSEPSQWTNPPVPEEWWPVIRAEMPAFNPEATPSWGMGAVAECFRKYPGVIRSEHPHSSFCAFGPLAEEITAEHHLEDALGDSSPLAKIYSLLGHVLLLGTEHDKNTSLHLAERRALGANMKRSLAGAPVASHDGRQWRTFSECEYDTSDFNRIGAAFTQQSKHSITGQVGMGTAMFMPQVQLVDFAVEWISENRPT